MKVGYARVSSSGQSLDVQEDTLKNSGCEKIFQEKVSGTSTQGRDKLRECLDFVREGSRTDLATRSTLVKTTSSPSLTKSRHSLNLSLP